ncbi:transcriptional regulator with XRE-family HTH domain [Lysinibacillus composti]|uniref:XRE family transcriptional regulator n=1 Tax=Lysinibacillus composti TaxID=720633 RepID=A0A3N9UIS7_9BACI|nr:helix-turn-helix transcriptional regulator [Lysinibacillus composti]MBM7607539.1 transcriptional regulator with XRE-family HTH domain [Lysinibacillus composti]RQW75953.1 XRE family transcriptional regulator [Lysinibacillus composti]
MFGDILAKLRKDRKLSQYDLAERMGFSRGQISNYEQGTRQPDFETLQKFADFFEVSTDYLLGRNKTSELVQSKEERDIAKRLEAFKQEIENSDGLAFNGEPISDEAKESLIESMEHIFRQTQRINKKYTPKKYRDEEK